jgi:hypothetical protein
MNNVITQTMLVAFDKVDRRNLLSKVDVLNLASTRYDTASINRSADIKEWVIRLKNVCSNILSEVVNLNTIYDCGICNAVYRKDRYNAFYELLLNYCFVTWPKWNKTSMAYPILEGGMSYVRTELWVGEQRELRIDLLKHIIQQMDDLIALTEDQQTCGM